MTGISRKKDSLQRREKALEIRERYMVRQRVANNRISQDDEILRYDAETDYACSLFQWNRWGEASPVIAACLEKYREWGTPQEIPYEYGKYYANTAVVRMYEDRMDEAISLAKQAVNVMSGEPERAISSQTFRYRFTLACITLQAGRLAEALHLHEEVLKDRQRYLGMSNTQTLTSIYAVGAMHHHLQHINEAE